MKDNFCTIYKLVFNRMQQFFIKNGQTMVYDPVDADIVIAGLCAAFDADEERSLKIISDVAKTKKPMYVYGCLCKVSPEKIKHGKIFYSWNQKDLVESIVKEPKVSWDSVILPTQFRTKEDYRVCNPKKQFVGISTGCSFTCSYCPHKIGSGEIVSRPQDEILMQIKSLIEGGVGTIVLTGTDTACYGIDIGINFPLLLENVLKISDNTLRYHIAQFNPEGLSFNFQKLISCCSDERVTDMQLPVQTSSERLLKIMHRSYPLDCVQEFIESVRKENRNIMFRTDLLAGFPTEAEDELEQSIDFVIRNFDEIAVYGYEYKKNTPIAAYGLPFFGEDEINRRANYTIERISTAGKIVHSGGQNILTLFKADEKKELLRLKNMEDRDYEK